MSTCWFPFQSLLHQGISLLYNDGDGNANSQQEVSIPSSSGHQFTGGRSVRTCGAYDARFQSLLHQGISLLSLWQAGKPASLRPGFNPFFIRASVYCNSQIKIGIVAVYVFQSLLHQGISLLAPMELAISILSSRFNPFFIRASVYWRPSIAAHTAQRQRFNPFFIRASVYCL